MSPYPTMRHLMLAAIPCHHIPRCVISCWQPFHVTISHDASFNVGSHSMSPYPTMRHLMLAAIPCHHIPRCVISCWQPFHVTISHDASFNVGSHSMSPYPTMRHLMLAAIPCHHIPRCVIYMPCDCRDREIQFFELSSFEPYCQINCLETVPLNIDYRYVNSAHNS